MENLRLHGSIVRRRLLVPTQATVSTDVNEGYLSVLCGCYTASEPVQTSAHGRTVLSVRDDTRTHGDLRHGRPRSGPEDMDVTTTTMHGSKFEWKT